ncbi:MAG TPA: PaaI family thioesterase [Armatimonadota bacterium]|jgi:uncharacterized protein (TIGR00369 family)
MDLQDGGMCFACGPKNPIGLKLKFEFEDGVYTARFTPGPEHQGYDLITHGGIVTTLLDEAMAKLVFVQGHFAVTAEINVRFRRPAMVGDELTVTGRVLAEAHRLLDCAAEIRNSNGELIAEASGKMMKVRESEARA